MRKAVLKSKVNIRARVVMHLLKPQPGMLASARTYLTVLVPSVLIHLPITVPGKAMRAHGSLKPSGRPVPAFSLPQPYLKPFGDLTSRQKPSLCFSLSLHNSGFKNLNNYWKKYKLEQKQKKNIPFLSWINKTSCKAIEVTFHCKVIILLYVKKSSV